MSLRLLRSFRVAILTLTLALVPEIASACPVCFSGTEETRFAFLLTTIFLTLLPLLLVGSLVWWLRRRVLEVQALEERESVTAPTAP